MTDLDPKQVQMVLLETSHPGNIGSAARALKTMGFAQLVLVKPPKDWQAQAQALAMAAGADDVLASTKVFDSLDEAIGKSEMVVGLSARSRALSVPVLTPRAWVSEWLHSDPMPPTSILFGRERIGLTNEELNRCHYHIEIPSNPEYSSLNLAQAVQVMTYEIRSTARPDVLETRQDPLATAEEVEGFYQHLESALRHLDIIKPASPLFMSRLRRLFQRAQLEQPEVRLLRGICKGLLKQRTES